MKSIIIQLIESKGIKVPKSDYETLIKNWNDLQQNNPTLGKLTLTVEDIIYQYNLKDDYINEQIK